MSVRTISRISALLGLALLVSGGLVFANQPASALEKERIVIGEGEKVVVEHGPLAGMNQGAQVDASTTVNTDLCMTATFCDAIPLTVRPPRSFSTDDAEYFVRVTVSWRTVDIGEVPTQGQASLDDIDLWIVNDPFVEDAGASEDGFAYKAASLAMPEMVQMYQPAGDWYLLVNNAASLTLYYTVEVEWLTRPFPSPFESLPPGFLGGTQSDDVAKPSLIDPPDRSAEPPPVFDLPDVKVPDLAIDGPAAPDAAFDQGFDDGQGLVDQLDAPEEVTLDAAPAAAKRPDPPSGLVLILWMVGFPLLLLGIGAAILQRRRDTFLQL